VIDLPPEPPALPSKPPVEGLVQCGLEQKNFKVVYDDELQGYVIEISSSSGATNQNLQCVWDATWTEFVHFEDKALQTAYDKMTSDRFTPLAIKDARDTLAQRGLLKDLPKRADFPTAAAFAVAIERHCGVTSQVLKASADSSLLIEPAGKSDPSYDQSTCLFAAMIAAGETKFGFIGNEKVAPSKER
jgi:hypothetical protein